MFCIEVMSWWYETFVQHFWNWVVQQFEDCNEQSCSWWCLCCNKWLCWIATVILMIVAVIVAVIMLILSFVFCILGFVFCALGVFLLIGLMAVLQFLGTCTTGRGCQGKVFEEVWKYFEECIGGFGGSRGTHPGHPTGATGATGPTGATGGKGPSGPTGNGGLSAA